MAKHAKLLERFKSNPKDFTFAELITLLQGFGYQLKKGAGSRVRFEHPLHPSMYLHRPHPKPILKSYQIRQILDTLTEAGLL